MLTTSKGAAVILVTGGAGFIGANFILDWLRVSDEPVLNLDALTYAGPFRRKTNEPFLLSPRVATASPRYAHSLCRGDKCAQSVSLPERPNLR